MHQTARERSAVGVGIATSHSGMHFCLGGGVPHGAYGVPLDAYGAAQQAQQQYMERVLESHRQYAAQQVAMQQQMQMAQQQHYAAAAAAQHHQQHQHQQQALDGMHPHAGGGGEGQYVGARPCMGGPLSSPPPASPQHVGLEMGDDADTLADTWMEYAPSPRGTPGGAFAKGKGDDPLEI